MSDFTVVVARHMESGQIKYRVYLVRGARNSAHAEDVAREAYEVSDEYIQYAHDVVASFFGHHTATRVWTGWVDVEKIDATHTD